MTTATHTTNTALDVGFTINRARLVDALTTAGLAVPKRPDMPVLGGVVLHARGDHVTIRATDYTTSVSVRVAGTVRHPGALVVDHAELTKLLAALVKGTPKRDADRLPVTVRTDDGTPVVDLAGYTMPLTSYVASDYPTVPDAAPTVAHVDRRTFAENMGRVLVAVGTDDVLPMLTGVRLEFTPGQVTMAGTDRYRLAVASVPSVSATQAIPMVPALAPARLLASTVARFTGDRIRVGLDSLTEPSLVSLSSADVTVTVRTLDDSFPAYRRLLPDTTAGAIQTDRAELLTATRRAAAVLDAKRNRHKDSDYGQVIVTVTPDSVSVAPRLAEHADTVTAPAQPATVAGITDTEQFWFMPAFLVDALNSFTGDTVTLHTQANPTRPVLFTDTPDGLTDSTTFRHLLMPVHPPRN